MFSRGLLENLLISFVTCIIARVCLEKHRDLFTKGKIN